MNSLSQLVFAPLSLRPTSSLCPEGDPTTHGTFPMVPNCPLHWRHNPSHSGPYSVHLPPGPLLSLFLRVGTLPVHPHPVHIGEASATRPGTSAFPTQSGHVCVPCLARGRAKAKTFMIRLPEERHTLVERHQHRRSRPGRTAHAPGLPRDTAVAPVCTAPSLLLGQPHQWPPHS